MPRIESSTGFTGRLTDVAGGEYFRSHSAATCSTRNRRASKRSCHAAISPYLCPYCFEGNTPSAVNPAEVCPARRQLYRFYIHFPGPRVSEKPAKTGASVEIPLYIGSSHPL